MSSLSGYLGVFLTLFFLSSPFAEAKKSKVTSDTAIEPVVRFKTENQEIGQKQQEKFEKLMNEGKRLYLKEMDNVNALEKFKEAESVARTQEQKADVYFYLSLTYYALRGQEDTEELYETILKLTRIDEALRKLIVFDYHWELDKSLCPPNYVRLFEAIKREYGALRIQTSPAGADVYVEEIEAAIGKTPLTLGYKQGIARVKMSLGRREKTALLPVAAGKTTESPVYSLKKKSGLFFWVGGAVMAGGTAALLLFSKKEPPEPSGSISVYSTPAGAMVFLDNVDTGLLSNCTLTEVSTGSHTLKLVKEGYHDEEKTVVVEEDQITTVNVSLTGHSLTIIQPTAETVWTQGDDVDILWETDTESCMTQSFSPLVGLTGGFIRGPAYRSVQKLRFDPFKQNLDRDDRLRGSHLSVLEPAGQSKEVRILHIHHKNKNMLSWLRTFQKNSLIQDRDSKLILNLKSAPTGLSPSKQNIFSEPEEIHIETLSNVKIELFKGNDLAEIIVENTENSGSYTWSIPKSLQHGTDYRVKVSCAGEPGIAAESDKFMLTFGYQFLTKWGSYGTGQGQFKNPSGISVRGYVYVLDYGNFRIQKFSSEGQFIDAWGSYGTGGSQFLDPLAIAVNNAGNILVTDFELKCVKVLAADGTFLSRWGQEGHDPGDLQDPMGIVVDELGFIYIADAARNKIIKFTSAGDYVYEWGDYGTGNGQIHCPSDVAVDDSGYVYVVDHKNNRIQKFTSAGVYVTQWGSLGSENGQFDGPIRIAVDQEGFVYVTQNRNQRVQKFSSTGGYVTKWGTEGSGDGEFDGLEGIAVDESGHVYTIESTAARVQKFGPDTTESLNKK